MSVRKYVIGVILGVIAGALIASKIPTEDAAPYGRATRKIASEKWSNLPKSHVGKVAAPVFVQIFDSPESKPENGYYKLVAHISFNQALSGAHFQWALPAEARLISGAAEGDIQLFQGENEWEETVEIQVTDTKIDQNVMFDLSYQQNGNPLGSSDIFVFRSQAF